MMSMATLAACGVEGSGTDDGEALGAGGKADGACAAAWTTRTVHHAQKRIDDLDIVVSPEGRPTLFWPELSNYQWRLTAGVIGSDGQMKKTTLWSGDGMHVADVAAAIDAHGNAHACYIHSTSPSAPGADHISCRSSVNGTWAAPQRLDSIVWGQNGYAMGIGNLAAGANGDLALGVKVSSSADPPDEGFDRSEPRTTVWSVAAYRASSASSFERRTIGIANASGTQPPIVALSDGLLHAVHKGWAERYGTLPTNAAPGTQFRWTSNAIEQAAARELVPDGSGDVWGAVVDASSSQLGVFTHSPDGRSTVQRPGVTAQQDTYHQRNRAASVATGRDGTVHVAAVAEDGSPLYITTNASGEWSVERIAGHNMTAGQPAIAVDASGRVHAAYWDTSLNSVMYAYRACAR